MTPVLSASDFANAAAFLPESTWLTRLRGGQRGGHGGDDGRNNKSKSKRSSRTSLIPEGPGSTCRQFNWTETTAVQALLQRHQNPPDCEAAKFLVYVLC